MLVKLTSIVLSSVFNWVPVLIGSTVVFSLFYLYHCLDSLPTSSAFLFCCGTETTPTRPENKENKI